MFGLRETPLLSFREVCSELHDGLIEEKTDVWISVLPCCCLLKRCCGSGLVVLFCTSKGALVQDCKGLLCLPSSPDTPCFTALGVFYTWAES